MLNKFICLLLLCSVPLFSQEKQFPKIIDFSTLDPTEIPGYENCDLEEMSQFSPFNGAIEFGPFFAYLKNAYFIEIAVETGTWMGWTTAFLGYLFNHVYTMEIDVEAFEKAQASLRCYPNIDVCYGNSPDILRQILPTLKGQRLIFYLDAHWFSYWPIFEELEIIGQTHRDNCIIVVDDFKVPGRPDIPYDWFEMGECSYESIRQALTHVYSDYTFHYLVPKNVNARAKFLAIPKKWAS